MNKKKQVAIYVFFDIFAAMVSWFCFFSFRKFNEPYYQTVEEVFTAIFSDPKFYLGISVIPLCWVLLYMFTGTYRSIYRKSRIKELEKLLKNIFFGSILLFFAIILDDHIVNYRYYI